MQPRDHSLANPCKGFFVQNLGPKIGAMAAFTNNLKSLRSKKEEENKGEPMPAEKYSEVKKI